MGHRRRADDRSATQLLEHARAGSRPRSPGRPDQGAGVRADRPAATTDREGQIVTISPDNVRQLLEDESPDAVLVLIEGRAEVISQSESDSDAYRGALQVVSRDDLLQRIGGADLSDRLIEEQAAILDTTAADRGGKEAVSPRRR